MRTVRLAIGFVGVFGGCVNVLLSLGAAVDVLGFKGGSDDVLGFAGGVDGSVGVVCDCTGVEGVLSTADSALRAIRDITAKTAAETPCDARRRFRPENESFDTSIIYI